MKPAANSAYPSGVESAKSGNSMPLIVGAALLVVVAGLVYFNCVLSQGAAAPRTPRHLRGGSAPLELPKGDSKRHDMCVSVRAAPGGVSRGALPGALVAGRNSCQSLGKFPQ